MKLWSKVRLKSNNIEMQITSIIQDLSTKEMSAICKWLDQDKNLYMATFRVDDLEIL